MKVTEKQRYGCWRWWAQFVPSTRLPLYRHLGLTHSMVQSPSWEANWFAASQEIPRISRNPKVHYRTHKRPPPISILGQPNDIQHFIFVGKNRKIEACRTVSKFHLTNSSSLLFSTLSPVTNNSNPYIQKLISNIPISSTSWVTSLLPVTHKSHSYNQ